MSGEEVDAECNGREEISVNLIYCRNQWMREIEQIHKRECLVEQDIREERQGYNSSCPNSSLIF